MKRIYVLVCQYLPYNKHIRLFKNKNTLEGKMMLINFEFKNHLSYRDDTVFSMETGKRLRKLKENTYEVQKSQVQTPV